MERMKAYQTPVLTELGSMSHVTRKSGSKRDPQTMERNRNEGQPAVCDFMWWLPPCNR